MALLDEIEARLSTQGVAGIVGTTSVVDTGWVMTKGYMPADPDRVLTIYPTGGPEPEAQVEINYPTFQIRARAGATGYSTAMEKLATAQAALHGFTGTLSTWYYPGIWAQGDVLSIGFDVQDTRPVLAQNYRAARSRTS